MVTVLQVHFEKRQCSEQTEIKITRHKSYFTELEKETGHGHTFVSDSSNTNVKYGIVDLWSCRPTEKKVNRIV